MIYIAILSLNNRPTLERLLASIEAIQRRESVRVIVLEQQCKEMLPPTLARRNLGWIPSNDNKGCAGGRGYVVDLLCDALTPEDIIVFLDDDCYAVNDTWLDALIAPIVGGRADISGVEGMIVNAAWYTEPSPTPTYVSGGRAAISAKVFLAGINFDPQYYPNYWEDVDLCYQATRAGFRIVVVGNVGIAHDPHPSNDLYFLTSRKYFMWKWQNQKAP